MSYINYSTREINCKIAYVGPAFSGKTTNLQYIYNKTPPDKRARCYLSPGERKPIQRCLLIFCPPE